jgi:hypothetical protein
MRFEMCRCLWGVPLLLITACDGYHSPTAPASTPLTPPPPPPTEAVEYGYPAPAGSAVYLGSVAIRGANPKDDCVTKAAKADVGRVWTARLVVHHPEAPSSSGSLEANFLFGRHTACTAVNVVSTPSGLRLEMDAYCGLDQTLEYGKSCEQPLSWFYPSEAELPSPRGGGIVGPGTITIRQTSDADRMIFLRVDFDLQPPA